MSQTTVIGIGELLVEFVSHTQDCQLTTLSEYSGPYPSGAPAIFADQVAQVGANAMVFGSVGDDGFGKQLLQRLENHGVNIQACQSLSEATTGVAFVSYNQDGSRHFIFHLSDTAADSISYSDLYLPNHELILHISGASLGSPKMRQVILEAIDGVILKGGKICCDPNARPELLKDPEARDALLDVMSKSSFLLPSEADLSFLFPDKSEAQAIEFLTKPQVEIIALKRGHKGVSIRTTTTQFELAPWSVNELDPTGAGDCFCGTLMGCISQGMDIKTAATYANAAGAMAVTKRGPMEGNSDLAQIKAFIKQHSSN